MEKHSRPAPKPSVLSRALRHAIAHCRTMFEAEMRLRPDGTDNTPMAQVWREQAQQYREILAKIEPKRKPKIG